MSRGTHAPLSALAIRALRPRHTAPNPWRSLGHERDRERQADGTLVDALTVFLVGRECPFTCVFCDLWRFTTSENTPPGALPTQLRQTLDDVGPMPEAALLKLYNASNFFDIRSVPAADHAVIAKLASPYARVVVECHAKLVGDPCFRFAEQIGGRLEVAMGLETVHPEAFPRLGKAMTLDDFARAAARLTTHSIPLRVFVLIGAPYVPAPDDATWVARAASSAFGHGAEHVALIPTRAGNGAMEQLAVQGDWTPPTLHSIEEALDRCLVETTTGVVTVDPWDLEALTTCAACSAARIGRIERMNQTGKMEPRVSCAVCGEC